MSGLLAGQVGIVTGGGKGLGRAFCLHLAANGAALVVNNRNRQVDADGRGPADHVVAEIGSAGGRAVAEYSDVADPAAGDRLVRTAVETFGRCDFLVCNAAVSNPEMFHKTTPERFDALLAINVGGTAHVAMAASRHMRTAGYGRIVLVSSTGGLHGEPTASAYSASKGALIGLGRAIAVEGDRRGVLTNLLLPYATTQMTDTGMDPRYREAMTAAAVAPVVTALVDPAGTLNGQVVVAGGGGVRAAAAVEYGTVRLPQKAFGAAALGELLRASRDREPREFPTALAAFFDLAADVSGGPAG